MTTAHRAITGVDLHVPGYVQSGDPGAVGAGKLWHDTDDDKWYRRDAANAAWIEVAGAAHPDLATHDALGLATQAELDALIALVATDAELAAHTGDTSDAHDASAISISDAAGDFTATEVEGALAELQADNEGHAADPDAHHVNDNDPTAGEKTWLTNGLAGSVAFPATQAASADPNTLDDYEEGTFTPALEYVTPGSSSWSITSQVGFYTKIGNRYFYSLLYSGVPTNGTASGNLRLTGLPFTSANVTNSECPGNVQMRGYTKANFTWISAAPTINATVSTFNACGSGQANIALAVGDIPTGGTVTVRVAGFVQTP